MAEKVPLPNSVAAVIGISSIVVVVEGDLEIVVNALKSDATSFSVHGHLTEEAMVLPGAFSFCSFFRVRRQGNFAAHHIA